uniref:endonuclease Q family protein n=1 Tax=uncultured Allobacillus sp. TaxID=1638025 RepID=UPI002595BC0A|nr:endonuclease Q family protein [uncultured Allobacillus sp.]
MSLSTYYADIHIHIGETMHGKPVKISASNQLRLSTIMEFVKEKKGLDLIGIIDAHVPAVLEEIELSVQNKKYIELPDGGISNGSVMVLLGSEIEIYDSSSSGPIHILCFFATVERMKNFSQWYRQHVSNPELSSQRIYVDGKALQEKVKELEGLFIPAHIFTPFKSLYGKGVKKSLTEVFDPTLIDAVELGLSSDTNMVRNIEEIKAYPFLTNSDAHSLEKIAREYNALELKEATFNEFAKALKNEAGRKIQANYGMNPHLGKYHHSVCKKCETTEIIGTVCPNCGSTNVIRGVSERIKDLSTEDSSYTERPPYIHQVPLDYIPGLGPKTLERLREHLHHDMYIIHRASFEQLKENSNERIARKILDLREGKISVQAGGGGVYGKIID